jgi:2-polyprenyl-3-methyl-5-hydroxy-6-metoxy-1,4-benzoquinol methylase
MSDDPEGRRGSSKKAWLDYYDKGLGRVDIPKLKTPALSRFQEVVIDELSKEIENRKPADHPVRIWSAGSGQDIISLVLKSRYGEQIEILIQDLLEDCIAFNQRMFTENGLEARFVAKDLFATDTAAEFDIVFNTGLLEHFSTEDQKRLIEVFASGLKKGGVYLTATPSSRAKIYIRCKRLLEERGEWPYGPETPILTLKEVAGNGLFLEDEYDIDALGQLGFIQGAFPVLGRFLVPAVILMTRMPRISERILLKIVGGYCVLSKFSKG